MIRPLMENHTKSEACFGPSGVRLGGADSMAGAISSPIVVPSSVR